MSQILELERTFLVKYLPLNLDLNTYTELVDIYFPKLVVHPNLRVRKKGHEFEITKKVWINNSRSEQIEHTIQLTEGEFTELSQLEGKMVSKKRFRYSISEHVAEIDIFTGELEGLVLVDFEFDNRDEKDTFTPPDFCLIDVTEEEMLAGGMLAGKSYSNIKNRLEELGYKRI